MEHGRSKRGPRATFVLAAVAALLVTGCGGRTEIGAPRSLATSDAGALAFPAGTYTSCALGVVHDDAKGSAFLVPGGFEPGASLTLAQSGDTVSATYAGTGGEKRSLRFAVTTSTTATLAPAPQATAGFGSAICAFGVGVSNEKFYPTDLHAGGGALTYESGTVFVSVKGALESSTDCGEQSSTAGVWLVCGDGPRPAIDAGIPPSVAQVHAGDYACSAQLATHATVGGKNLYVSGGGAATLVLAQEGAAVVTTGAGGDAAIAGALHWTLTTPTTASADVGQSLMVPCALTGLANGPPEALEISAGSLAVVDSTVFVSFAGTMGASTSCPGARKVAGLVCTKK